MIMPAADNSVLSAAFGPYTAGSMWRGVRNGSASGVSPVSGDPRLAQIASAAANPARSDYVTISPQALVAANKHNAAAALAAKVSAGQQAARQLSPPDGRGTARRSGPSLLTGSAREVYAALGPAESRIVTAADEADSESQDEQEQSPGHRKGRGGDAVATADRRSDGSPLNEAEQRELEELRQRDAEVRQHEQAHVAAAGEHALGGAQYEYRQGPDGQRYAVAGHVAIDTSPVRGDPQATIQKMNRVRQAALAPAEPSASDRQVAMQAMRQAQQAQRELGEQKQAVGENDRAGDRPPAAMAGSLHRPAEVSENRAADQSDGVEPTEAQAISTQPVAKLESAIFSGRLVDITA
jgi:hypothetical protein